MPNPLSLNKPFYCEHCGDNLTGIIDEDAGAFVLLCPRTQEPQRSITVEQIPALRLEERNRLAVLFPAHVALILVG